MPDDLSDDLSAWLGRRPPKGTGQGRHTPLMERVADSFAETPQGEVDGLLTRALTLGDQIRRERHRLDAID